MKQIKDVKVTMFQYGLHAPNLPKRNEFCLTTTKIIYIDDSVVEKYINSPSVKYYKSSFNVLSFVLVSSFLI